MSAARSIAVALALAAGCSAPPPPSPPSPPRRAAATPPAEPAPRRSEALDRLFGDTLARWVVALDGDAPPGALEIPEGALGDAARSALEAVVAGAAAARAAPEAELDAASDRLDEAVARLDRALVAAGLGYAVDGTVLSGRQGERAVLLFSFTVDRVRRYRSAGGRVMRALWARRLDRLGFRYQLVGMTGERRDPLILLGPLDEQLCRELLPAAANPERWPPGRNSGAGRELGAAVSAALAADLSPALGADRLESLGRHLDERLALFERLADRLAARGMGIDPPGTLTLDWPWRDTLTGVATADELERLGAIERELARPSSQIAFAAARRLSIAAVEHHELQHQIDLDGELAVPPPLASGSDRVDRHVAREASAYLAQIARQPASAHLSLVQIGGFAVGSRAPAIERRAAQAILVALAGELAVPVDAPPRPPEAMASMLAALLGKGGDDLAGAASRVWSTWFGGELAPLALVR